MFVIDLNQTIIFNIGIDIFACLLVVIIQGRYANDFVNTYENRLLQKIGGAIILALITDMVMWIMNGKPGILIRVLGNLDNVACFMAQVFVLFFWFRYAWYRIFGQDMRRRKEILFLFIPLSIMSAIVITSPLTGWCFYLDDGNLYHRGILSASMSVVALGYMFALSMAALVKERRDPIPPGGGAVHHRPCFVSSHSFLGIRSIYTLGASIIGMA